MPTYQYSCTECGHFFEQVQRFSDDALTECPACQGRLRKVFNAVGVVFKGSGFYRTDSRSDGSREKAGATTDAGTTAGSGTPSTAPSAGSSGSSGGSSAGSSTGSSTGSSGAGATGGSSAA